jgi:hypothetical protein
MSNQAEPTSSAIQTPLHRAESEGDDVMRLIGLGSQRRPAAPPLDERSSDQSEDAARAAADQIRTPGLPPGAPVTLQSVGPHEVVAQA